MVLYFLFFFLYLLFKSSVQFIHHLYFFSCHQLNFFFIFCILFSLSWKYQFSFYFFFFIRSSDQSILFLFFYSFPNLFLKSLQFVILSISLFSLQVLTPVCSLSFLYPYLISSSSPESSLCSKFLASYPNTSSPWILWSGKFSKPKVLSPSFIDGKFSQQCSITAARSSGRPRKAVHRVFRK